MYSLCTVSGTVRSILYLSFLMYWIRYDIILVFHTVLNLVRSQHLSAQWNLRGGRWSSAEFSTKKNKNPPKKYFKKGIPLTLSHVRALIRYLSLPFALCGIWYYITLHLSHRAGSGIIFLFTFRTVRDLVWYSSSLATHCNIWYYIPLYLSHCMCGIWYIIPVPLVSLCSTCQREKV